MLFACEAYDARWLWECIGAMQLVEGGDEFSGGEFAGCTDYDNSAWRRRDTVAIKFAND